MRHDWTWERWSHSVRDPWTIGGRINVYKQTCRRCKKRRTFREGEYPESKKNECHGPRS